MIVADCTLLAEFFIKTKTTSTAEAVFAVDRDWIVPPLWRSEFRNVLRKHVLHAEMLLATATDHMVVAEARFVAAERPVMSSHVLTLAATTRCSAYDAEYVSLAMSHSVPLVTSDRRLRDIFPDVAISPVEFLSMSRGADQHEGHDQPR